MQLIPIVREFRRWLTPLVACLLFATACSSPEAKLAGHVERATEYREQGLYREAVIEYKGALLIDPNRGDVHFGLAESYRALGNTSEAFWELQETVRLDPENHVAKIYYAQTLALSPEPSVRRQALEIAQEVVAAQPESAAALLAVGRAQIALARLEDAIFSFKQAIELEPENGEALRVLANAHQRHEQSGLAEQNYRRAVEVDPGFISSISLAQFLAHLGERDDEAIASYENAIGLANDADATRGIEALASFLLARGRAPDAEALLLREYEARQHPAGLMRALARLYTLQGRPEKSEELVREAVARTPNASDPHITLAAYLMERGDFEGALDSAERALELDPSNPAARLRHAHVIAERGRRDADEAEQARGRALLNALIEAEPPNLDRALVVRGRLELGVGERQAAIQSLRRAIDLGVDTDAVHTLLGAALLPDDPRQARNSLRRALELAPNSVQTRILLADVHTRLGESDLALEVGAPVFRRNPEHVGLRLSLVRSLIALNRLDEALKLLADAPTDAGLTLERARVHVRQGDSDAARAAFDEAGKIEPHSARVLGGWLALDAREQRLAESEARIAAAVRARPDDGQLAWLQGRAAYLKGEHSEAREALQRAIKLAPENLPAYLDLAGLLTRTGEIGPAVKVYEQAAEQQPNASLRVLLGILHESAGRYDDAIHQYEQAVALDAKLGVAKNNLAYLLAERGGDLDRALDLAREAKGERPTDPGVADTLGWVLHKRGSHASAVAYLKESERGYEASNPTRGEVRMHLARALVANGEKAPAIEALENALTDLKEIQAADPGAIPAWVEPTRALLAKLRGTN